MCRVNSAGLLPFPGGARTLLLERERCCWLRRGQDRSLVTPQACSFSKRGGETTRSIWMQQHIFHCHSKQQPAGPRAGRDHRSC